MKNKRLISVIVCTYNGEKTILKCLESLSKQNYPKDKAEIIVVDNNSTDNTKKIVLNFIKKSKFKIRYIYEQKKSLSHARNLGIYNSRGGIVAFIDDDATACSNWLINLAKNYQDKKIASVGGKVELTFIAPRPKWLSNEICGYLSNLDLGNKKKIFPKNIHPVGCNMSFRKKLFNEIGDFPTSLGRIGSSLISCEETEIYNRIPKKYKIIYEPDATVYHRIDTNRLKINYFIKRYYAEGISKIVLNKTNKPTLTKHLCYCLLSSVNQLYKLLRTREIIHLFMIFYFYGLLKQTIVENYNLYFKHSS